MTDWNKARKVLRSFVDNWAAIDVRRRGASQDHRHRGRLEPGEAELIYEAVCRGGAQRIPNGKAFAESTALPR